MVVLCRTEVREIPPNPNNRLERYFKALEAGERKQKEPVKANDPKEQVQMSQSSDRDLLAHDLDLLIKNRAHLELDQIPNISRYLHEGDLYSYPELEELINSESEMKLNNWLETLNHKVRLSGKNMAPLQVTVQELMDAYKGDAGYNHLFSKLKQVSKAIKPDYLSDLARFSYTLSAALKTSPAVKEYFGKGVELTDKALEHMVALKNQEEERVTPFQRFSLSLQWYAKNGLQVDLPFTMTRDSFVQDSTNNNSRPGLEKKLNWAKKTALQIDNDLRRKDLPDVITNPNSILNLVLDGYQDILKASSIMDKTGDMPLVHSLLRTRPSRFGFIASLASGFSKKDAKPEKKESKSQKPELEQMIRQLKEYGLKVNHTNKDKIEKLMLLFTYLSLGNTHDIVNDPLRLVLGLEKPKHLFGEIPVRDFWIQ